jgi:hypothetical protein
MGDPMQKHTLNGTEYYELEGEIEAIGSSQFSNNVQMFPHVRFRDGRLVRNILADNATAPYVDAGARGKFFFRKWGKALVLVGVLDKGLGYRAADPVYWSKFPRRNRIVGVVCILLGLLLAYGATIDGMGFAIAAMFPLAFGAWGLWEYKKDAATVELINSLGATLERAAKA